MVDIEFYDVLVGLVEEVVVWFDYLLCFLVVLVGVVEGDVCVLCDCVGEKFGECLVDWCWVCVEDLCG